MVTKLIFIYIYIWKDEIHCIFFNLVFVFVNHVIIKKNCLSFMNVYHGHRIKQHHQMQHWVPMVPKKWSSCMIPNIDSVNSSVWSLIPSWRTISSVFSWPSSSYVFVSVLFQFLLKCYSSMYPSIVYLFSFGTCTSILISHYIYHLLFFLYFSPPFISILLLFL